LFNNALGRANLDGSNPNQTFITTGVTRPRGIALDSTYLYWTNSEGGVARGSKRRRACRPLGRRLEPVPLTEEAHAASRVRPSRYLLAPRCAPIGKSATRDL
jgi:hypothetical protein